jgi:hypothetical protein
MLSQDIPSSGRDLNPVPPEYEAGMLTTQPRRSTQGLQLARICLVQNNGQWWALIRSGAHVSEYAKWRSRGIRATQCLGYSWATLSPGGIHSDTWSCRLEVACRTESTKTTHCGA